MDRKTYLLLLLLHVGIGVLLYLFRPFTFVFAHGVIVAGIIWVFRNRNANEEALMVAAYIVGSELLVKMARGYFIWEYAKYAVILVMLMGIYYKGFSRSAVAIWIFGLLLIPGVVVGMIELGDDPRLRQSIIFNIIGPLTLLVVSLYCYMRRITVNQLMNILLVMGLPIVSCVVYSILYTPDLKDVLVHTGSNFETSGGYGPNQVATFFGLGMFIFFVRAIFASPTTWLVLVNLSITFLFAYRALLTFSRGGLITGLLMVVFFLLFTYVKGSTKVKLKISFLITILIMGMFAVWMYTTVLTGGLIEKRYKNQDALGRDKENVLSGREQIALSEIAMFLENPIFGNGVGSGYKYREEHFDISIASHNEVTRMIGEHGVFGILAMLILIITPMVLYLDNKNHFFLLSFLLFWFLTLNHTAMRVATPAFIYALTLLKIQIYDVRSVYRKQTLATQKQPHVA